MTIKVRTARALVPLHAMNAGKGRQGPKKAPRLGVILEGDGIRVDEMPLDWTEPSTGPRSFRT